ncbi:MAG TPA: IS110 family transposase [Noviherbaspirillum sp.]|nr:IS110 family transposase [Noviherbaspirillum sp.]
MKEQIPNETCWGVDVASEHLDIARHGSQQVQRIGNDPKAIAKWLRSAPANSRLGLESTGSYHLQLARLAHERGITVYVLNPRDIKRYAQGLGQRGKTDRLDARVIARFIEREHEHLRAWQPPTQQQQELDDLLRERAALQKTYAALKQSVAKRPKPAAMLAKLLHEMKAALQDFERAIAQAVRELPQGDTAFGVITSIPGIGLLTGAALLRLFTRAPDASTDAIVALTGLDPRPMDSGTRRGVRRLSKRGDANTRRLLYNAGMAGAKTDTWRPIYERERAKGLSSTAALLVLARRLVRIAYSLFKSGQQFDRARVMT